MSDKYIVVGKLGRTRGLDGEIYITPITDFPDRFLDMKYFFVSNKTEWEKISIVTSKMIGARPVVKFDNIRSPEDAAKFVNRKIAVLKEDLVELPEKTFYIFDLIGCKVIDEAGEKIGEIIDVEQYPANDAYVIEMSDETTIRFPAVKQFVKSIDIDKKLIIIDKAGMLL